MANFAVIKNSIVEDIIVADSLEIAQLLNPDKDIVEFFPNNPAHIGLSYIDNSFEQPPVSDPRLLQFTQEEWESYINSPARELEDFRIFDNPEIIND